MLDKKRLLENNNIEKVLEFYGFCNIVDRGKEYRCGISESSNPTSICVLKNDFITAVDFARDVSGDIFTLIMELRNKTFGEVMREIRGILGIDISYSTPDKSKDNVNSITSIFDGLVIEEKSELEVYPEETLNQYQDCWNTRFLNDGISIETQKKFNIMFDTWTERIVIPHRDKYGDLCGVIGRANYDHDGDVRKYFPLIQYRKGLTLFGYAQNYNHLYQADVIYIGEAEKFVLQLDSMGYYNAVSLSGSSISKEQILMICKLRPKKVVFCFDEGLKREVIYRNVNKFKLMTGRFNIKTEIMLDKENKYLKKGSKDSPTDAGIEVWESLVNECCFEA